MLEKLQNNTELIDRVNENTRFFREGIEKIGLDVIPGVHPIVPIMIYDAVKAIEVADYMLELGIYVVAFKFPVVPKGKARIRTQISAGHTKEELRFAIDCLRTKAAFDL